MTTSLADLLRHQIAALEAQLKRGNPHECRNCMWYACQPDKCHCGCGAVGKERAYQLERLRALADCIETGEIPTEQTGDST